VEAYYIEVPKKASHGYSWHEVYNELVVENEVRNQQIINILIKLNNAGISTLCLVKEIAHGDYLSKFSGLPFANGESEDCEEMITLFKRNEIKTLIATTGVCGEGVDMKPCEYVVIAGLGKSKNQIMQNIGRVLRIFPGKESGKVIIFKDLSHKWTHAHYREQVRILKQEYGAIAVKLEV
jgi:superfamily II DNA or RNA helicase